jgi:predicted DNA-binding transcriptional regulator AlpA
MYAVPVERRTDLPDRFLTEKELSRLLQISLSSIRRRRNKRLPPKFVKIGALVRYDPADVRAFIEGSRG